VSHVYLVFFPWVSHEAHSLSAFLPSWLLPNPHMALSSVAARILFFSCRDASVFVSGCVWMTFNITGAISLRKLSSCFPFISILDVVLYMLMV
jgi:hypothetical protein